MKRILPIFVLLLTLASATLRAQTANVQVIHNSADPALASVDVYVNGQLAQAGLDFRDVTSSSLVLPSNTVINLEVRAPGGSTALYTQNIGPLTDGASYVIIASGVATPGNFTANPDGTNIGVNILQTLGRQTGQNGSGNVDLLVYHGATDAPTVDVVVRGGATLIDDLSYTDFQGYASVPAGAYVLDVYNSDQTVLVASYFADLTGLGGGAATVFASGFLDDSQGPGFGLFVALGNASATGQALALPLYAPTANLQVIHNAADPAAASVDVYVNGTLAIPGFDFRDATPFIELPAGTPLEIGLTPAGSMTVVYTLNLDSLEQNTNYIAIANGVLTPANFTANPDAISIGFDLYINGQGQLSGQTGATNVDLLVFHGATDAPTVDVVARGVGTLIDDLSYTDFQGYASVPVGAYILDVYNSDQTVLVASYFADLTGLGGGAATVFASGFLDDSQGEGFGLFVALGGLTATGQTLELPLYAPTAQLQVIHNAADPAAASVDVYVNGNVALDDFDYLDVSSFLTVPAGLPIEIEITPAASSTVVYSLSLDSLETDKNYIAFANGVLTPANFTANPDAVNIAFDLFAIDEVLTSGSGGTGTADVLIFHGSTDAPTVDISARGVGVLADDLSYTDFNPSGYINVPTVEYILDVQNGAGTTTLLSYYADLSSAAAIPGGAAAVVFASGFLDDSQGPGFGLYVALAGLPTTSSAIPLPQIEGARVQVIHNAADPAAATVDIYVVSAVDGGVIATLDDVDFRTATAYLDLPSIQPLEIAVAPGNSTDENDAIATFDVTLANDETYVVIANGVLNPASFTANPDGENIGFNLFIESGKEAADISTNVELLLFHGATDAPTVDIVARGVATIGDDLNYGDATAYLPVPASTYIIDVNVASSGATAASYTADLTTLAGGAGVAFASGFLDASQGDAFGVWVALPDGTTFPLPAYVGINEKTFTGKVNMYPNPAVSNLNISLSLDEAQAVAVTVYNTLGQQVLSNSLGVVDSGDSNHTLALTNLNPGVYTVNIALGNGQRVNQTLIIQ